MRKADTHAWKKFFTDRDIGEALATMWANLARPNISLIPATQLESDTTEPGASKFGGLPDLPADAEWPTSSISGYDLTFRAQLNLTELSTIGHDLPLPSAGLLLFFQDDDNSGEEESGAVIFVRPGTETERREHPEEEDARVHPLKLVAGETLPHCDVVIQMMIKAGTPYDAFKAELGRLKKSDYDLMHCSGHGFGGWPTLIQGRQIGDGLLLQLDSDETLGWMFGDCGKAYFMCEKDDMLKRRFGRSWVEMQCY